MSRWIHPYVRAASVAVLSCLMTAGVLVALTRVVRPPAQDRQASPGTAWLSGESRGRAVLAAPGSAAGSVAVALGDPSTYDVTSLAKLTAVFDRQTGGLVLLDPGLGTIKERKLRLLPRGEGTLVPAGATAFLVDATALTVRRVAPDGRVGDAVQLDAFTDAVGTSDGQLWLFDAAAGAYGAFNGSGAPKLSRIVDPSTDVAFAAVGTDAVLLDRSTRRLHWLGRGATAAVADGGGPLLLQETDLGGFADCVTVVDATTASCVSPKGIVRQATLPAVPVADAQVLAGAGGLVIAGVSTPDVLSGPWGSELTAHTRTEPSPRHLVAWSTPTAILVDDPGSRYAFTAAGAAFTSLDKFNKRTVLITPDGPKVDLDSDTQLVTKLPSAGAVKPTTTKIPKTDDNPANEPPTPNDDRVRTRSGRPVNADVLANDTDPDGDTLVVVSVGSVTEGAAKSLNGSTVLYSPPATFVGTVEFQYTVADPGGLQASAAVTVDVVGADQNESPTAVDDTGETPTGVPVTVAVLANDSDPEGDPLSIIAVGTPAHGAAAVTADGQLRYEPAAGYVGSDDLQYTIVDGHGGRASALVHIVVDRSDGKNRPPLAVDDRGSDIAGKRVRIAVLQNDADPDGDAIHIVSTGNVFGVTATIVGGQSIDIVPDLRTTGIVTVPYTIEDAGGLRASAQVILVVEAPTPNRAPQAIDDNAIVASEVKLIDVVGNDVDPDGDPMTIVSFTQPPIGGSVTKASATALRFVPTPGFTSRTSFQYTISDPDGLQSTAKVNVEVVPPTGSGPVAVDDAATISINETARVDVLANDSQPDGVPFGLAGPPTVRAGRAVVNPDNSIAYTPPAETAGTFVLTYTIRDFYNRTASAKLVVTVLPRPVGGGSTTPANNRPPAAADDRSFTPFQTPVVIDVLANDSEPDGQALGIASVAHVTGGIPAIIDVPSAPNSGSSVQVRFQPDPGFTGLASFTYVATDPLGGTASAKVVVEVGQRLKVSPIGRDDLYTMAQVSTLLVDPRSNDLDPDGSAAALRISGLVEVPAGITVSVEGNGTELRIVSAGGGTFAFGYSLTDADGLTGSALVTVTVSGPTNKPPVAVDDAQSTPVGVPVTIDVLANDTDDGPNLAIQSVNQPAAGGTTAIVAGKVTFTPTGPAGTYTFTYKVVDSGGLIATGTVTVTVLACTSLPPLVSDDIAITAFNTARSIDLFANDARANGALALGAPSSGTIALGTGAGVVVFTPAANVSGRSTFTYTVTTVCNQTASATVTVTVNPANRAPVAVNDTQSTTRNTPVLVDVLGNDSDPDGDTISVVQWSNEAGGTVSREPNSTFLRFTPAPGFIGQGSFVYVISDALGVRASASVTVTVSPGANHAPTPQNDTATATPGVAIAIDVLANDTDPDGDILAITNVGPVNPPGTGSAAFGFAGVPLTPQITFTPSATFTGPSTFTYTVTDGRATATATVTVNGVANRPPVAVDDNAPVTVGVVASINVVANDTDPDGDLLTLQSVGAVSPPGAGTATMVNGKVEFTGAAPGTASMTYVVVDPGGLPATGTLVVTISPPANQSPNAFNDAGAASGPGGTATVNVVNNDSDPDGDPLTIVTSGPPNPTPVPVPDDGIGTVSVVGADTIVFTILPTFTTPGTFTVTVPYTVSDGRGGTASATLTITVTM